MKDDLISKKAAIEAIQDFKQGAAEWRDGQEERSDIWHRADSAVASAFEIGLRIIKLPAAQERKGKWIYKKAGGWHCSECGKQAPFWCFATTQQLSDFCPNCGAEMEDERRADG